MHKSHQVGEILEFLLKDLYNLGNYSTFVSFETFLISFLTHE